MRRFARWSSRHLPAAGSQFGLEAVPGHGRPTVVTQRRQALSERRSLLTFPGGTIRTIQSDLVLVYSDENCAYGQVDESVRNTNYLKSTNYTLCISSDLY